MRNLKAVSVISLALCFTIQAGFAKEAPGTGKSTVKANAGAVDQAYKPGAEAFSHGKFQEAATFFEGFCAKNPKNETARYYYALSLQSLGKSDKALEQFNLLKDSSSADIRATAEQNIKMMKAWPKPQGAQ